MSHEIHLALTAVVIGLAIFNIVKPRPILNAVSIILLALMHLLM